jgi:hypothetical protein
LVVGWLVAAVLPNTPHPVLLLRGEQGVGKSTAAKALGELVDPTAAPLRAAPRDIEQWAVAASSSWLVALDNLSGMPGWLSDALCRAVTGEGLVRRRLYSDDDVTVLTFRRVLILTAIDAGALRGDLTDRLLSVDLEPIDDTARRTDDELARRRSHQLPQLLGSLYDLVAEVLGVLPSIHLRALPRMADFAKVLAAVDQLRPRDGPSPMDLYRRQALDLARDVVEGDPFAQAVRLLADARGTWRGTADQLRLAVSQPSPLPRSWPASPRAVGGALRRAAPGLRAVGITIKHDRTPGSGSQREIILRSGEDSTP